ncbi:MAG TPA: hypothetical protein VFW33_15830 [Gemmataceae bacterium]|nr:hypothetical protein [Gemmataceae bacterium]
MGLAESPWRWRALCLPKHGHAREECEDAWAADPAAGRFAVADGASECAFAPLWARLLTGAYVAAPRPGDVAAWLPGPRCRWREGVAGLRLPWYGDAKREEGAFATFLGLDLRPPAAERPGGWDAVAVGDTCLVRVRRHHVQAFPVARAADFDRQPALLASRGGSVPELVRCAGSLRRGDRLLLMTDALARWFLTAWEMGECPWDELAPLLVSPEGLFAVWVAGLRSAGDLRDDDVTLLSIELPSTGEV